MQDCVKYVDMTGAKTQTTILIIEDDVTMSENIALILEMEGFGVRVASDGPTGLAMIRQKKPHLILCDILMSGMDGYSVIEVVKKNPFYAKIPFLFISALNERDHVRKGMSNGADDYLTKPFSTEELLAAINARLQRLAVFDETPLMGPAGTTEEQRVRLGQVTRREKEVLLLVGKGLSSKEIAQTLFISKKTVDVHRDRLMKKLGATNAVSLASWAGTLND